MPCTSRIPAGRSRRGCDRAKFRLSRSPPFFPPRVLKTPVCVTIDCRPFPPIFLEGGAGERVQGARAAYGTCFACPDHQGPPTIPDLAAYQPFVLFVTSKGYLGIKCPVRRFLHMSGSDQGKGSDVLDEQDRARFEQLVLPHLDAAFNLARWLLRSRADSEDVAQEAMLRAYRFFRGFHGGDARAWLLQIVRNTCYTWLEKNRPVELMTEFDEELHPQPSTSPEALAIAGDNRERLTRALETLPPRFREVLVLRELEGCSYKEIAEITSTPMGTVMSSLSRARRQLQSAMAKHTGGETTHEL